ncbi:MAG: phosphopantetheine-binding protein [Blastochloris sp.]|jgi:acyl carrier protein|nr:phosphopantetheine-binding protein [Blastochloris sp.]
MEKVTLDRIRQLIVENCMLKVASESIGEETLLFGPEGLGLDSIDALQLTLGIESTFNTPIKDPKLAIQILRTPGTIKHWVIRQLEFNA